MAAKTVYIATDPDGGQHTRTSHRTYTHAVLVKRLNWEDDPVGLAETIERLRPHWTDERGLKKLAEYEAKLAVASGKATWYAHTFCGRPDLALKAAATITKNVKADEVYIAALTTK